MKEPIMLSEEELQLIGELRYKEDHPFKVLLPMMVGSYLFAIVLALVLMKVYANNPIYVIALIPIAIPTYLSMNYSGRARKGGKLFKDAHRRTDIDEAVNVPEH